MANSILLNGIAECGRDLGLADQLVKVSGAISPRDNRVVFCPMEAVFHIVTMLQFRAFCRPADLAQEYPVEGCFMFQT